jgi:hypothetical protein
VQIKLPNNGLKADSGFAATSLRAAGWHSFGYAKAVSLSRRRSICGTLGGTNPSISEKKEE